MVPILRPMLARREAPLSLVMARVRRAAIALPWTARTAGVSVIEGERERS